MQIHYRLPYLLCVLCHLHNYQLLLYVHIKEQPWLSKKVKVKVHTLNIAPLRSESPPQKRSGMARVLKGLHSFTCTPTRSSTIGMIHTCLCLPSRSWYSFTDPGGMEGWVSRPWCEVAPAEIRTCNLAIANPALYHTATSAPLIVRRRTSPSKPGFKSRWYPYHSLVATGRASGQSCSCAPVKSYLDRHILALEQEGVSDVEFGCFLYVHDVFLSVLTY